MIATLIMHIHQPWIIPGFLMWTLTLLLLLLLLLPFLERYIIKNLTVADSTDERRYSYRVVSEGHERQVYLHGYF